MNDNFQMKNYDIFLILALNADCGHIGFESCQDWSGMRIFSLRNYVTMRVFSLPEITLSFDVGLQTYCQTCAKRPYKTRHIWLFRQVVSYCCLKIVQKAPFIH